MKDSRTFEQIYVGLITEEQENGFFNKMFGDYGPIMDKFGEIFQNPIQPEIGEKFNNATS